MSLKYECDSCGQLSSPGERRNGETLPAGWSRITIHYDDFTKHITLCVPCTKRPMQFGDTTFEIQETPTARPAVYPRT